MMIPSAQFSHQDYYLHVRGQSCVVDAGHYDEPMVCFPSIFFVVGKTKWENQLEM